MQQRRPYPWHDFTINDWLAVDADDHVCFVESWREGGAPRWITIPTDYLASLRMRLENACGHSAADHDTTALTDKEIADSLGIYFLSSSDGGGTPIRYVYEAIPTVPCLVHDLPKTFSEIANHIRLPTKRLMNGDEIVCTDWQQGTVTTLDTEDMANGVLVEKLDPTGAFWLPPEFKNCQCDVMGMVFLPNSRFKDETTTTFPSFVVWKRYSSFFVDIVRRHSRMLSCRECEPYEMDPEKRPARTMLFYDHGVPVGGYTFGPPGGDSFLLDHGVIHVWFFAKAIQQQRFQQLVMESCRTYGVVLYFLPNAGCLRKLVEFLHTLSITKKPLDWTRFDDIKVCYPQIPMKQAPHAPYLLRERSYW